MSTRGIKTDIETSDMNYFIFVNPSSMDTYVDFIQDNEVLFCYVQKNKKVKNNSQKKANLEIPVMHNYVIGDKEYKKIIGTTQMYGNYEYSLILYMPTGRIFKDNNVRKRVR